MTRSTSAICYLQCDRCKSTMQHDINAMTNAERDICNRWSTISMHGGNPSSIIGMGDGYKADLCPGCTTLVLAVLNKVKQ